MLRRRTANSTPAEDDDRTHPGAGGANRLIRDIVRHHWGALGGAAASTVLMTLADLAQPWPLKYLIDNLVTGRSIPFTITSSDLRTLLPVFLNDSRLHGLGGIGHDANRTASSYCAAALNARRSADRVAASIAGESIQ